MRASWLVLGAALVGHGVADASGWLPGTSGLVGIGLWVAGLILLSGRGRASRIEASWSGGLKRMDVRFATLGLTALGVLLGDLLGVLGVLIVITVAGLGTLLAATRGTGLLASLLVKGTMTGSSLVLGLFILEGVMHLPAVATKRGTPAELARWMDQRYDRLWQSNVLGLRSPYEIIARSPNSLRVLALGDSFTWGDKIADSDSTWPAQLERVLAAALPGRAVEVINMGRNGFTTFNEAELLRRLGWQFEPDIVILQYHRNDALPSGPNFRRESGVYAEPRRRLLPSALRQGRIASSALLDLLETEYSWWRNSVSSDPWPGLYSDDAIGWRQVREALGEMGAAAHDRGVPIYLLLYPRLGHREWGSPTHPDVQFHRRITAAAKDACMRVLDMTPILHDGSDDGRRWHATPYDSHPNEHANEVVARTLGSALLADGVASDGNPTAPHPGSLDSEPSSCGTQGTPP